jgi:signal transduction histidine kinase
LNKFIDTYEKQVMNLQQLLDQLEDFVDPESMHFEIVDVKDFLHDLTGELEKMCAGAKIKFFSHLPQQQCKISIDKEKLADAIKSLVTWSLQTMPPGGQIWLTMEYKSQVVEFAIKDTGRGLSAKEKVDIFDPVFIKNADRLSAIPRAQVIITQHGGKLMIDSQEHIGTEWIIHLPTYQ